MVQEPSLQEMTLRQLRNQAMQLEISRYSRMSKTQLIQFIREARADLFGFSKETVPDPQEQEKVASTKFHAGGAQDKVRLADVDAELGELPEGYGRSRIVLLPRDPQWAYAYWDVPNESKEALREQGGQQLALRLIDATSNGDPVTSGSVQEYPCTEVDREWYLPIPVSDRAYQVEIGYRTATGEWLLLARSASITMPPSHPSDWIQDHFVSVSFDQALQGQTVYHLEEPPVWSQSQIGASLLSSLRDREGLSRFPLRQVPGSLGPWLASGSGGGGWEDIGQPARSEWVIYGKANGDTELTWADQVIDQDAEGAFEMQVEAPVDPARLTVRVEGEIKSEIHIRFDADPQ